MYCIYRWYNNNINNFCSGLTWSAGPDMPIALGGHCMAKAGNKVFIMGGMTDGAYNEFVITYNVQEQTFKFEPHLMKYSCLLYTSPSPRDLSTSRMPSSA